MKKLILVLLIGFICGFLTHAVFFPDLFAGGIFLLPQAPQNAPQQGQTSSQIQVVNETKITFDGTSFSRTNVRMESSRYISITNMSQNTTMDLNSSEPGLSTPRPYAYLETVRTRIDKPGQYVVADRKNPTVRMVITVK